MAEEKGVEPTRGESGLVVVFDTANEVIAIGIGALENGTRDIHLIAHKEVPARRASNTQLLPRLDGLLAEVGATRDRISCIGVGRGPGSFTGVRIAMATAKGIASALGVGLIGISTQESIAEYIAVQGYRGPLLVASDAMRKEIYPSFFHVSDEGVSRLSADRVVKAEEFTIPEGNGPLLIAGDALGKYGSLLAPFGTLAPESWWTPTGEGLLLALRAAWRRGDVDPCDPQAHPPMAALPIYTRLSDAEENERARLSKTTERDLHSGVQGSNGEGSGNEGIIYRPMDAARVGEAVALEALCMGSDAWNEAMVIDDLGAPGRIWWMALAEGRLIGYGGARICGDEMELLKIAVHPDHRRNGIGSEIIGRLAYDAANLAATDAVLEVRDSNEGALSFYGAHGFCEVGTRPRYYSDGEDARLLRAPLDSLMRGPLGPLSMHGSSERPVSVADEPPHPLILALETSCDETAAAVVDGAGHVLSDVVASQIDFHARFGGVVPEIASRKHIEAICGVAEAALGDALPSGDDVRWGDLDAVAVTYAPGLVGALVVGVAFAKGAAWALDVPFIGVNHLEGHLYANKLSDDDVPFAPPAIVSLVSGGNTMLVFMRDWQDYEILGSTIDDAVGEAFDKVAKALGLPYPGGPIISRLARSGNARAVDFPRAMLHSGDYRFSLSGLKTAVITHIDEHRDDPGGLPIEDICASFQQAVIDVQVAKARRALLETGAETFCLGGGVAANPELRRSYEEMCADIGVRVVMPPLDHCGDNAAMIALVALDRYGKGRFFDLDADAQAHADLSEPY